MENLYYSITLFFTIYLLYFLIIVCSKKRLNKYKKSTEVLYLTYKCKIDINNYNIKKVANLLAISNAFILSSIFFISCYIENIFLKFLVVFALVFAFIILIYGVVGNELSKGLFKEKR